MTDPIVPKERDASEVRLILRAVIGKIAPETLFK